MNDKKLNTIPEYLKDMCSELSDQEQLAAYERLMEFMEIAWRIHTRKLAEREALTDGDTSIGLSGKDPLNTKKK